MMNSFERHPGVAQSHLELGLPHDAWNELEGTEPPQRRAEVAGPAGCHL